METRTAELQIKGMSCAHCVATIEGALRNTPGVARATVDLAGARATVQYDDRVLGVPAIIAVIEEAGYEASA